MTEHLLSKCEILNSSSREGRRKEGGKGGRKEGKTLYLMYVHLTVYK
jgi:hypothetical protein